MLLIQCTHMYHTCFLCMSRPAEHQAVGAGRGKKPQASDAASQKSSVVITQLPYQTNKAAMVATIANLIEKGTLTGTFCLMQPTSRLRYGASKWSACQTTCPGSAHPIFVSVLVAVFKLTFSGCMSSRTISLLAGCWQLQLCNSIIYLQQQETAEHTLLCVDQASTSPTWPRCAGISDVQDESDRDGMRVVLDVKRGFNPEVRNLACHASLRQFNRRSGRELVHKGCQARHGETLLRIRARCRSSGSRGSRLHPKAWPSCKLLASRSQCTAHQGAHREGRRFCTVLNEHGARAPCASPAMRRQCTLP